MKTMNKRKNARAFRMTARWIRCAHTDSRRGICIFLLYMLLRFYSGNSYAGDWPMFRGNESRTGASPETLTLPLNLQFKTFIGSSVSSPAKVGEKLFIGTDTNTIRVLNAYTGASVWQLGMDDKVDSSPAVFNGKIYVSVWGGSILALEAVTGNSPWRYDVLGQHSSSPLVVNNTVYVGTGFPDVKFYAFNADNGSILWQKAMSQPVYSSAAYDSSGVLVVGSNDGKVYFFNAQNGTLLTTFDTGGSIYLSAPAIDSGKVYVAGGEYGKKLFALDVATGQKLWEHNLAGADQFIKISSPAAANGVVYVSAGYPNQKVFAVDATNGALKWQVTFGSVGDLNYLSSPAVAGDKVFVGTTTGKLVVLDAATGTSLYEYQTGGAVISSPSISSGMVYVASTDGYLYGLSMTDTTSPVAVITSPSANSAFSKSLMVSGSAADDHLQKYVLSYAAGGNPQNYDYKEILTGYGAVQNNALGTWDASTLASGTYTVQLSAYDVSNNQTSAAVIVQLDNTPPALAVDAPADGLKTNQKDVTVSGTTEAGTTVTVNNNNVTVGTDGKFSTTVSLVEGGNTLTVSAKDSLNNETTVTRNVTLDTTPPALTLTSPVDGLLTNQENVTVEGTTESGATVAVNGNAVTVDAQGRFSASIKLSLGENTVTVETKDALGNAVSKSVKATYDPNAPSLEVSYPPDNLLTNNKDLTITGKTEAGSTLTINEVSVSVDAEGRFSHALTLSEGENTITVISSDSLGNKITASRKVTLDTKIPELVVDEPADGLITNQTKITVKGKAEVGATLKINDAAVEIGSDGAFSYAFSLQEGDNTLTAIVSDTAGNSMSVTRKVTLDIQPPTGTVALVTDGKTKGNYVMTKNVTLKLEAQDNLKVAQAAYGFSSDLSSSWKEFTQSPAETTLDLGECCGEKTIYVQYKDSAGNVSDADASAEGSQPYTVMLTHVKDVKTISLAIPGANPDLVDLGVVKVDMETIKSAGDLNFVLNKASFENADGAAEALELRLEFYNTAGKKSGEETLGRVTTWLYFKYDDAYKGAPLANESALAVFRYNSKGEWERLSGFQEVNMGDNTVKALVPLILNRDYTFQVVQEKSVSPGTLSVMNYPNPVHGDTTFSYGLSSGIPEQVTIEVYALTGKKTLSMSVPPPFTGKYTTQEIDNLPNGVYIYRIHAVVSGKTLTKTGKLVLLQ